MSVSTGAALMVMMRWCDRLLGLVSTLVLARLLAPDDFGVIALASVAIELIDVMLDVGVATTLVQNARATVQDYHAAWTLRLMQFVVGALLVLLGAPLAAHVFHEPRVEPVMQVLALATLISGFENIGIVAFQKNMQFGMDFRFFFYKRAISVAVTIAAALILHSFWALVLGTLVLRIAGVGLSYRLHPMRPRLCFSGIPAILSMSAWNVARSIGSHLNDNADRLLVGRRVETAMVGQYSMASDIAALPVTELMMPIGRVLLPSFVLARHDERQLCDQFTLALGLQAMTGIPAGVGIALVAPELVACLLGQRWMAAVPLVQVMGAISVAAAVSATGACLLLALGRARAVALLAWSQVLLFLALALFAPGAGAQGIAQLRLLAALAGVLAFIIVLQRALPALHLRGILAALWRPLASSAAMAAALIFAAPHLDLVLPIQLAAKVALGALTYAVADLVLWCASGRGPGPESWIINKLAATIALPIAGKGSRQ